MGYVLLSLALPPGCIALSGRDLPLEENLNTRALRYLLYTYIPQHKEAPLESLGYDFNGMVMEQRWQDVRYPFCNIEREKALSIFERYTTPMINDLTT